MAEEPNDSVPSKRTKQLLAKKKFYVRKKKTEKKYIKGFAVVNTDYTLLENQYAVRLYFQAKHDLTLRELELLLYLFPKQYFTHREYKAYPLSFSHRRISTVIKKGWVKIFKKGKNMDQHVFTLTSTTKMQVIQYYKYLGGEIQIPVDHTNPLICDEAPTHHAKVISFFKQMREKQKKEEQS